MNYNFEWDPIKARENRKKHDVAFDEATTIFRDLKAISIDNYTEIQGESKAGDVYSSDILSAGRNRY